MGEPTGADNAQVQDAADRISCEIVEKHTSGLGRAYIAQALREARREGMMEAIEEIAAVEKDMEGHAEITAEQNTFRYGAGYALGRAAREIERASGEG